MEDACASSASACGRTAARGFGPACGCGERALAHSSPDHPRRAGASESCRGTIPGTGTGTEGTCGEDNAVACFDGVACFDSVA